MAVFAGAASGCDPSLREVAYLTGRRLAERGLRLVYGAGGSGLMGAVSQGALDAGGEVIGVIPRLMVEREWGRRDLHELRICESMHERKAIMADLADAFLALPGGLGTLEEIFEVWTWRQLGFHAKPVGFLDVSLGPSGFWRPLLDTLDLIGDIGLIRPEDLAAVVVEPGVDEVLDALERALPPKRHLLAPGT